MHVRIDEADKELSGINLIDEHSFVASKKLPLGSPPLYQNCHIRIPMNRVLSLRTNKSVNELKSFTSNDEINDSELFALSEVSSKQQFVNKQGRSFSQFYT